MTGTHLIIVGLTVLLAAGSVSLAAQLSLKARAAYIYAQLVFMVAIYVGFAVAELDDAAFIGRDEVSLLVIEAVISTVFLLGGLAVLMSSKLWLLGALILGHGGIDLAHLLIGTSHVPPLYAFLCIVYDAIVGVAAIFLLSEKRPQTEG